MYHSLGMNQREVQTNCQFAWFYTKYTHTPWNMHDLCKSGSSVVKVLAYWVEGWEFESQIHKPAIAEPLGNCSAE